MMVGPFFENPNFNQKDRFLKGAPLEKSFFLIPAILNNVKSPIRFEVLKAPLGG